MGGNNPDTQRRYFIKWREANREKYLDGKRDHYQRNRESELYDRWARGLGRKFGISVEQYEEMLQRQNGLCAICGQPETMERQGALCRLSVDHNHETGDVRGLLCRSCNSGLGHFRDRPDLLERASAYLAEYVAL